ncbi:curli production assembly/transport component CsgF [Pontibacter actiniarum]|uniref:Curli production assembly/transport component CsgF n=1 Tax=Pontibacter actiniarum TaxID=323450 RepID=A0A1X9YN95_9BACT|nr:curli production assembly/transport component CsgF [Pontibacter actiniarum]ARS34366.1 curli production assembly/transport component CsgF [Pontibacter actiniarum]
MKCIFTTLFCLFVWCLLGINGAQAQDLVYTAKNPAFGGSPYNYSWLQSSAQSQDKLKDPNATTAAGYSNDPIENFKSNLNRQILNELSRKLVASQFGEDGVTPGSYTLGDYQIDVTEGPSGINIEIVDIGTGDRTTVTVPYY